MEWIITGHTFLLEMTGKLIRIYFILDQSLNSVLRIERAFLCQYYIHWFQPRKGGAHLSSSQLIVGRFKWVIYF